MIEIVKLPPIEWAAYRKLRLRALKEEPQAFGASYKDNYQSPPKEWQRRLINAQTGKTNWLLFAKDGKKLVGMIGAYLEKEPTETVTIIAMFVPNEERGRGIAKQLMNTLLDTLRQQPTLKKAKLMVNRDQKVAVSLYLSCGFKEVGQEHFKMGNGKLAYELVMERLL